MSRTAIVAAMEREVKPLVRGWRQGSVSNGARSFRTFTSNEVVVVISGIGRRQAEAAAKAVLAQLRPEQLISAGLAGALIRSLKAGSVVTPNVVVDAADGSEHRVSLEAGAVVGGGILVSADEIAGTEAKTKLVEQFHALVVDMEAAAVAKAAQQAGIGFRCVKAISDEADFVMPPLKRFVDAEGNFHSGRFALWTALRPWQWARTMALGRNAAKAVSGLCEWLAKNVAVGTRSSGVAALTRAEFTDVVSERR